MIYVFASDERIGELKRAEMAISAGDGISVIPFDEVRYITVIGRHTHIITDKESYVCRLTIANLSDKLKNLGIIRCHKAFLVNMMHIRKIDRESLYLRGIKEEIPIGKTHRGDIKKIYMEYLKNQGKLV